MGMQVSPPLQFTVKLRINATCLSFSICPAYIYVSLLFRSHQDAARKLRAVFGQSTSASMMAPATDDVISTCNNSSSSVSPDEVDALVTQQPLLLVEDVDDLLAEIQR